ncbi:phosphatidate cytidylyltransferase [Clostridiales bacterium COT073_COT-073]|nr:phosphatidate cytidylyltransferase [Clostridiales bacterium COT073_COT-073]
MKQRVLSAVVALPIVIAGIYFGGIYLYLLAGTAACIGIFEFNRAFGYKDKKLLLGMTMIAAIVYILCFYFEYRDIAKTVIGFVLMTELAAYVLLYPKIELRHVFINIVGFLYIPYMLMHILLIREGLAHGKVLVWLVLLIAFSSDTFAYFSGVTLGKHKLAPILSPKKTIEGAVGGIAGSILICLLYGVFLEWKEFFVLPKEAYFSLAALGFLGSLFSQVGDLVGSAIKRETGIKDFGNLIPGHGGILDRLDSILFVAPFVYYFMLLLYRWN